MLLYTHMPRPSVNTPIEISTGTIAKTALIFLIFFLLYKLLFTIYGLVLAILAAVVIASAIEPAAEWFQRYRIPRVPAVLTVYVIAAAVLGGLVYLFIPPLISETIRFISALPNYIDSFELKNVPFDTGVFESGAQTFSQSLSFSDLLSELRSFGSRVSGGLVQSVSTIFGGIASFILIVVFSFYLSVQPNGVDNFLRVVTPLKYEDYVIGLWHRSQRKIGRWMQGQLLLVLIMGVLSYLGLMVLGVRHALLLAVLAGLAELIPLFGPIIAALPALGVAAIDGGLPLALLVGGFYLILQQFENHLIYPLVIRKVVGVPALLIIIALIIGGKLAGFLGIILAVPAAAVMQELAGDIEKSKQDAVQRSTGAEQ